MPAPARRPAAAPAVEKVRFLDMDSYSGGGNFDLPEGRYCMFFDYTMHRYPKQDGTFGKEFLALHMQCFNLDAPGSEGIDHYISMGAKAMKSFLPNSADGGKSLVKIPDGPGTFGRNSNGHIFFRSMLDAAGESAATLTDVDDLTQIDGVWVVTKNILEPEERRGYGSRQNTGEVEDEGKPREPQKIPNVVEIIEGGVPWEGTGGLPDGWEAGAAPTPPTPKAAPKAAPKAPAGKAPAPGIKAPPARKAPATPPAAAPADAEDTQEGLKQALSAVITNPKFRPGVSRVTLRMEAFKEGLAIGGEELQQAVGDAFNNNFDLIESLMGEFNYQLDGGKFIPAA